MKSLSLVKLSKTERKIEHSGEKLSQYLHQFKSNKDQIVKKLESSIKNNNLYRNVSESDLNGGSKNLDDKRMSKERSMSFLKKNIEKRIQGDKEAEYQLKEDLYANQRKKENIQKRLFTLQKRNENRIREIQDFEKQFVLKVEQQIKKNTVIENRLKADYARLVNENKKIGEAKNTEKKMDEEEWKKFMTEKFKLQSTIDEHLKRQNKLLLQKNPEIDRKQKQKKEAKVEKVQLKQRVKLDAKKVGMQYLNFAKQQKSNNPGNVAKVLSKKNLLNVNLKLINYEADILEKLAHNRNRVESVNQESEVESDNKESDTVKVAEKNSDSISHKIEQDSFEEVSRSFVIDRAEEEATNRELEKIKKNIRRIEEQREKQMLTEARLVTVNEKN